MKPVTRVDGRGASTVLGRPVVDLGKAIWNALMLFGALAVAPLAATTGAVLACLAMTYLTLLIGHSVGMHRMMIHRSFEAPKWAERFLIYVGVLVGVAGPYGIIRIHDIRDWAQRQPACHDFFAHRRGYWRDISWQLFYRFAFELSPTLIIEPNLADDRWYQFMERTWRWHQLMLAVLLYFLGGWPFVIWCVCVRVAASAVGHWTVTYFCHNPGPGRWRVRGASVQASNIPLMGFITYGECWHNNHHAFPESARIGIDPGQADPAWRFIQLLRRLGVARNVGLPRPMDRREDLFEV